MSTISDFNRIEDCDKIDPLCIDAYAELSLNNSILCLKTSWGEDCIDLSPVVKENETCTTLYLSPEENPNCLVYEPECGDNICIHGDDISRIISMKYLKDVSSDSLYTGAVYMYNETINKFEPFDLKTALSNLNTLIQNIDSSISNLRNRVVNLETKVTPPPDAPEGVGVMFGNINLYSDPNVVIDSGTGLVTTLDKNHGIYSHLLANEEFGDEIFG